MKPATLPIPPERVFQEIKEPGYREVDANAVALWRDEIDPDIVRISLLRSSNHNPKAGELTMECPAELVLTWRALNAVEHDWLLLLDSEAGSLQAPDRPKKAIRAAPTRDFQRSYVAGCSATLERDVTHVKFWSRRIRTEDGNGPRVITLVELAARIPWPDFQHIVAQVANWRSRHDPVPKRNLGEIL